MNPDQLFELGYISDTHGIKGMLAITIDADEPTHYKKLKHVFIQKKSQLLPYFISSIKIQKDGSGFIQFDDITTEDAAEKLIGCTLHAPVSELPPLKENQFYYHELLGALIHDDQLGIIGNISEVFDTEFQTIVSFIYEGNEVMFPLHEDLYHRFDRSSKTLFTKLPDGLIEVYASKDIPDAEH